MTPTPKQLAVLTAIRNYRLRLGFSPTMQELADELGVSKVTVFEHVQALSAKKLVQRSAHRARSLTLSPGVKLPDETGRSASLPLVGSIAAGRPIEAVEIPDQIRLDELFATSRGAYVLRVRGDSMIEAHIADGDMVVVEQRPTAHAGEIVVALLPDGTATLKRFFKEKDRVRLEPANSSLQPIYVQGDVKIQGVVIGVLRSYTAA